MTPFRRRSFMFAGASCAAWTTAIAAAPLSVIVPGKAQDADLLAQSAFSATRDPSVSSQNSRQIAVPGRGPAIPNWPLPGETRQIWLQRPQSGEELVARYYHNGQLDMNEYLKVCRIMRDVRGGVAAYIDVEVLDLVFAIQKWLVAWGIDRPVLVQSGYRSPTTNSNTEGAARNSLHMHGRALDIRIPGVPAEYLGRLAAIFGVGGVGFYVTRNFVHTDTGQIRYWNS